MDVARYLFGFRGRIGRLRMWAFLGIALGVELLVISAQLAPFELRGGDARNWPVGPSWSPQSAVALALWCTLGFFICWTTLAVSAKRLHDRGRSAWWLLFFYGVPTAVIIAMKTLLPLGPHSPAAFLPLISGIVVFQATVAWLWVETLFLPGTRGANRFGPDPLS